jgi:hypothetical protein
MCECVSVCVCVCVFCVVAEAMAASRRPAESSPFPNNSPAHTAASHTPHCTRAHAHTHTHTHTPPPRKAGDADALAAATQPPGEDDPQPLSEEEVAEKERLLQVRVTRAGRAPRAV